MSIDEMAQSPEHWETVRDLIRSGQVDERRLVELMRDHPEFAEWYRRGMR